MKYSSGNLVFSPSDLVNFLRSPFASWMDRCHLESPGRYKPDERPEELELVARIGMEHEREVLADYRNSGTRVAEIDVSGSFERAFDETQRALADCVPILYQAALRDGDFAGYADFIELTDRGYEVWDTKLARSPKPYFIVQLCAYTEMLAATMGTDPARRFGVILGTGDRAEFLVEDFFHYYRCVKEEFLALQDRFDGDESKRPIPDPRADHGRWASHAEQWLIERDHLVQVAGITAGQIKKLEAAGIGTMTELADSGGIPVPKMAKETLEKLTQQAALQRECRRCREEDPDAQAPFRILGHRGENGEPLGLGCLPPAHEADVFFDMEGYPLVPGGLEYLFGACINGNPGEPRPFVDWWAHDREGEKRAFEGFVDWVHARWRENPGMHIYHYAEYEVSALRRLSTRHDTRQEEVDDLLRNEVLVDLYRVVRRGLRIGEPSYSLKYVERLYRPKRDSEVVSASGSIVQYGRFLASGHEPDWQASSILYDLREYNVDDCRSTAELADWLRAQAAEAGVPPFEGKGVRAEKPTGEAAGEATGEATREPAVEGDERDEIAARLRAQGGEIDLVLADLVGFHRREDKPMWWRMFDRAASTTEELKYDSGCIGGVRRDGLPWDEKRSQLQAYNFETQECKLRAGEKSKVMFTFNLDAKPTLCELDLTSERLVLKFGNGSVVNHFGGSWPERGDLIADEFVNAKPLATALAEIAERHLGGSLDGPVANLLARRAPVGLASAAGDSTLKRAVEVAAAMEGECLVIQGPPGCGKTYTASRMIAHLLSLGKRVGITSNGHRAITNLMGECGAAMAERGGTLQGLKVGGSADDPLFERCPDVLHMASTTGAVEKYAGGVVGGTAWLFARPEWEGALDYLFIDEAGQVPLANAVAVGRCASNLVLLGDQMQLEQPVEGSHPGDSGMSVLQYALKDVEASKPDAPSFHAVVPEASGLFLSESFRMHPDICRFISDSIYEGRLSSHETCGKQSIDCGDLEGALPDQRGGIVLCDVRHDGNIQRSDEEVDRVEQVLRSLLGRTYCDRKGIARPLAIEDFLFVAPYNAQVRALQERLGPSARVGSVDKFQGQEAPVCVLSLCSSFGEYGSRGLKFILDRNRVNVAISRAQCLAVVVGDGRIASTSAGSVEEMRLVNLFCKIAGSSR
jgi:predicted RecB family nuclease